MSGVARIESLAPARAGARWWRWHRIVGAFVVGHGLAHLVGVSEVLDALDGGSVSYLLDAWTITDTAALAVVGLVWAVLGIGLMGVGAWIVSSSEPSPAAQASLVVLLAASAIACFVAVPASTTGLVVDLALLATAASVGATVEPRPPGR